MDADGLFSRRRGTVPGRRRLGCLDVRLGPGRRSVRQRGRAASSTDYPVWLAGDLYRPVRVWISVHDRMGLDRLRLVLSRGRAYTRFPGGCVSMHVPAAAAGHVSHRRGAAGARAADKRPERRRRAARRLSLRSDNARRSGRLLRVGFPVIAGCRCSGGARFGRLLGRLFGCACPLAQPRYRSAEG